MRNLTRTALVFFVLILGFLIIPKGVIAQTPSATLRGNVVSFVTPEPSLRPTLTEETEELVEPLVAILDDQALGPIWPLNPIKYAIRAAVSVGVPVNTIVLLLLLPVISAVIAAFRHLVGLRGFGIFLPAALAVTFLSTGPVVGIGLFLIIVTVSTLLRFILKRLNIRLQYLPRMAMTLLFVSSAVLGVLFVAPIIPRPDITNVSIFPVLILVLLAEDFSTVQFGKSAKTAINLTTESLILALISYMFLTLTPIQVFVLLNPEVVLLAVLLFDYFLGKYVGLRFVEYWRFRKLLSG